MLAEVLCVGGPLDGQMVEKGSSTYLEVPVIENKASYVIPSRFSFTLYRYKLQQHEDGSYRYVSEYDDG